MAVDAMFEAGSLAKENVTFTFRRANGDSGPVTQLRRDDAGNHYILTKQ